MDQKRLGLYTVDIKYVRNLARVDDNVMSVSPQIGKSTRPFIGLIVICNDKQYCVPLSSPKEKHKSMKNDVDFSKIYDANGKLIGVLNFNNMIPVREDVIEKIEIRIKKNDVTETKNYKNMMINQLRYCRQNQAAIVKKANKLYQMIVSGNANSLLKKRCCKFNKLEKVLAMYKQ